jgi:tetratricopeptide (TPR) repeat protein
VLEQGRSAGRVLFIGAAAGVGKSALVGATVRHATEAGVLCLVGSAYEQESVIPLGPVRDALGDYLLRQSAEDVRVLLGDLADDLALVVPELAHYLGLRGRLVHPPSPDLGRLFGAVLSFLHALAARQPILLCLEDLHAADGATIALLQFLERRTRTLPFVLVGTFRPEDIAPDQDLARLLTRLAREGTLHLRLSPLDRRQSGRLIDALLAGPTSRHLGDSLYAATEGNPLFLEQSVLALHEQGRLDRRGNVWHGSGDGRPVLPTIVHDLLQQRFGRLSRRCHETVAMAAILGRTIEHEALIATLEGRDELTVVEDLEEALRAQVLQAMSSGYAFTHALMRDAIYGSLIPERRRLLHARAGSALERLAGEHALERAAELAYHFVLALRHGDAGDKALRYSLEAGRRAAALSAAREALDHFTHACELLEAAHDEADPDLWLEALEGHRNAEFALWHWQPVIADCERILDRTTDPVRRGRARISLGFARQQCGDTAAAMAEYQVALAELDAAPDRPDATLSRFWLQLELSYVLFLQGQFNEMLARGQQILHDATESGQPLPLFWGHNVVALAQMGLGQTDAALEHSRAGRDYAAQTDDKIRLAVAESNLGVVCGFAGKLPEALPHLERAVALYGEAAADLRAANPIRWLGRVYLGLGDLERAREHADLACAVATQAGDRWLADCLDLRGLVHLHSGEWDAAEASFDQAIQARAAVDHAEGRIESLLGKALVRERRGRWQDARVSYEQALQVATTIDPSPFEVATRRHLGRLLHLQGDPAATEHLERALTLAETMPASVEWSPTVITAAEINWRGDDLAHRIAAIEAALAAGPAQAYAVEARCVLADLQIAAGDLVAGQAHAKEALDAAERFGSSRLVGLGHLALGRVLTAARDRAAAAAAFDAALAAFDAAGTPFEQARTRREYAALLAEDGDRDVRAAAWRAEASQILRQLGLPPDASPSLNTPTRAPLSPA